MRIVAIETPTHGRVIIREAGASSRSSPLWVVGFHGYGQNAEDMMAELELIPGSEQWTLVSVQALHRFYTKSEKIVANWMTRQDREFAIEDNIAYIDRTLATMLPAENVPQLVFVGFSQGVAMAYRAAVRGSRRPRRIIAIGGDVPPELKTASGGAFPSVLIAAGESDPWYTSAKLEADVDVLRSLGVDVDVFRYAGAHEFTPELRQRIHQVLASTGISPLLSAQ